MTATSEGRGSIGAFVRHWAREPLVHFLIAGLGIFLFFMWRGEPADPASRTIVIEEEQVTRLTERWQATWQRAPTPTEIDGLIRDHIKEEVYYREARRLGLDEDDPIVRRRLRAKMEYLARAAVEEARPDDATLQQWLDRNPGRYASDALFSFDQIYLGQLEPEAARARAESVQAQLRGGARWEALGATISLTKSRERATKSDIARDFGDEFAAGIAPLAAGEWSGPISSGFGQHLVRVRAVTAPRPPQLSDVRQTVENDWRAATMAAREARAYQLLLDSYDIRIAAP